MAGDALTYADLSLFQALEGLRYAFPNAMGVDEIAGHVIALGEHGVSDAAYISDCLSSPRRIAFNEDGIFRRYPELDRRPQRPPR